MVSSRNTARQMIRFKSFCSGSAGNCYYLGIEEGGAIRAGILIDAGASLRRVKKELAADGLTTDDFSAILITHDHCDHIRSLGSFCKHLGCPVWATGTLMEAISGHFLTRGCIAGCRNVLKEGEWNEIVPGLIRVYPFVVPHDATQTVGFAIELDGYRYVHITDCGRMTKEATDFCRQAQTVVLESNYDTRMLENGPYPPELQVRIKGGHGHMSNDECAEAIGAFIHDGLKEIFLCHLSENNNTPELAYACSKKVVGDACRLETLPRRSPTKMFVL